MDRNRGDDGRRGGGVRAGSPLGRGSRSVNARPEAGRSVLIRTAASEKQPAGESSLGGLCVLLARWLIQPLTPSCPPGRTDTEGSTGARLQAAGIVGEEYISAG